jgi:hypothetical protein
MAIKHTAFREAQRDIDLDGPDGNAMMMVSLADSTAHQLDYNEDERKKLRDDMMSDNYVHLVRTFDKHFGDYFTLYTKNVDILQVCNNNP